MIHIVVIALVVVMDPTSLVIVSEMKDDLVDITRLTYYIT